jgi:RNA polymerase sigma factor (sigma-70 family)
VDQRATRELQWAQWMQAGLKGDARSYGSLLQALTVHVRSILRYRMSHMRGAELELEDIVQETLLAIHLKRHTWRQTEPLGPWVNAICRNKLVDVLRRSGRRAEVPLDDVSEAVLPIVHDDSGAQLDVLTLLQELGARQREIIRLVALEGHSAQSAATRLGMSAGALRVALHRSLHRLAGKLRQGKS